MKNIQTDIEKLKRHPNIVGVEYLPKKRNQHPMFCFYTRPLKVKFNMRTHQIGHYKIELYVEHYGVVRITNLQGATEAGFDHWSVQNKRPCLDQWADGMHKLFDTGQIYLIVDTFIRYLTTTNSADGRKHVIDWLKNFKRN